MEMYRSAGYEGQKCTMQFISMCVWQAGNLLFLFSSSNLQWLNKKQYTMLCKILFLTLDQIQLKCTFHDFVTITNVVLI